MLGLLFLLGTADVIGRYLFNRPITGTVEMGRLLLALMVVFSWGHTQILKGHVNVDMFLSRFPPRARAITNFTTTLLVLVFFSLFAWQSAVAAELYHRSGQLIYVLEWPLAPFQLIVSMGTLMFCLVLILDMIDALRQMKAAGRAG